MNIELYIAIMAGFVLSFFLMVSEIVFMRKRLVGIRAYLRHLYQSRQFHETHAFHFWHCRIYS